jgi:hypothetical protein
MRWKDSDHPKERIISFFALFPFKTNGSAETRWLEWVTVHQQWWVCGNGDRFWWTTGFVDSQEQRDRLIATAPCKTTTSTPT